MKKRKKCPQPLYLLTGGSGILGTELQKSNMLDFWAPSSKELDITDPEKMALWFSINRKKLDSISGVIHAAAFVDVPGAEINQEAAIESNVIGTRNIVRCFGWTLGVPIIYISTDYVYAGTGSHSETDIPKPVNYYAMTKFMGEAYLREEDLIVRTSFKPNTPWEYKKSFDDLHTSADYVDIIVPKILNLIVNCESGVYNIGTERKTIYDLARRRNTNVKPMSRKDIKSVCLPQDVSMDLSKYEKWYEGIIE